MAGKASPAEGQVIQYTTIKVRLQPTPAQAELFDKTFGCCRYIWNQMLSDQQRFYAETGAHFIPPPGQAQKAQPLGGGVGCGPARLLVSVQCIDRRRAGWAASWAAPA